RVEAGATGRAAVDPGRRAGYSAALADGDGKRVSDRDEGSADALIPIHRQAAGPGAAARPAPGLEHPAADRRGGQGDRGAHVEAGAARRAAIDPGRRAGYSAAL